MKFLIHFIVSIFLLLSSWCLAGDFLHLNHNFTTTTFISNASQNHQKQIPASLPFEKNEEDDKNKSEEKNENEEKIEENIETCKKKFLSQISSMVFQIRFSELCVINQKKCQLDSSEFLAKYTTIIRIWFNCFRV